MTADDSGSNLQEAPSPARDADGMSLLEVLIAATLLSVLIYGLASTFQTAHIAQSAAREQHAGALAAATQLEELVALSQRSYSDIQSLFADPREPRVGWGGFPVRLGVVEIGAAGTLALGTDLVPADADSGLFPPERASGPASDLDYAGYVVLEALDPYPSDPGPQTRWPTRVLVAAVVAWRSVGGDNASVNYSTVLINPSVIPVPGP